MYVHARAVCAQGPEVRCPELDYRGEYLVSPKRASCATAFLKVPERCALDNNNGLMPPEVPGASGGSFQEDARMQMCPCIPVCVDACGELGNTSETTVVSSMHLSESHCQGSCGRIEH